MARPTCVERINNATHSMNYLKARSLGGAGLLQRMRDLSFFLAPFLYLFRGVLEKKIVKRISKNRSFSPPVRNKNK